MRKFFGQFPILNQSRKLYGTKPNVKFDNLNEQRGSLIISCKRSNLNHYSSVHYNTFDNIPLASKGWRHSKSTGDFFAVHPYQDNCNNSVYKFQELGIHPDVIKTLATEKIYEATEFQYKAYGAVGAGSHLLLAAETGCGKTLSYVLPIVQKLLDSKSKKEAFNTPRAVILLPNRELAHQIGDVAATIGSSVGLRTKVLVGGKTKSIMMNPVFEDIDILIATPGALAKLSAVDIYRLKEVQFLVLDEADTLLDDSFVEIISKLVVRMAQSQVIFVSATVPQSLPDSLKPLEDNLNQIVSPKIHKPLLNITQKFMKLTHSRKPAQLLQIAKTNKEPMIVFSNKNERCNWVALFLRENGLKCSNINGDMNYAIRIDQWNQFVRGETNILSATDVASRGLNTIQINHLLNYDFPLYAADYLHRIGRIGRLGSPEQCKATNFIVTDQEVELVQQIELAIRRNYPLPNVDGNITKILNKGMRRITKPTS